MAPAPLFICYSTDDGAEFAGRLVDALQGGSPAFATYLDSKDLRAGRPWDDQLRQAILDCSSLLFVMTRASVRDDSVCMEEWTYARAHGKRVIPLLVHAGAAPPFRLHRDQHVDFTGDFEAAMERLRAELIGAPRPPAGRPRRPSRPWPLAIGGLALLALAAAGLFAVLRTGGGASGSTGAATPSPAATNLTCPASRPCRYQVELAGNPCLAAAAGAPVRVRACDGSTSQQWIEDHDGRQFTLRSGAENTCVTAVAIGEPLAMRPCSGPATRWTATANGDASYTFHSVAVPGACIAGTGTEGGPVVLAPCDEAADQRWY